MKLLFTTICFVFSISATFAQVQTPEVVTQDTVVLLKVGEQTQPTSTSALNQDLQQLEKNYQSLAEREQELRKKIALLEELEAVEKGKAQVMQRYRQTATLRDQVAQAEAKIAKPKRE